MAHTAVNPPAAAALAPGAPAERCVRDEIARWVAATHGILPSSALFHAEVEKRHLATPDGLMVDSQGRVILAEIKTTKKALK